MPYVDFSDITTFRAFTDPEGKIPARSGDRVALVIAALMPGEDDADPLMLYGGPVESRPILRDDHLETTPE